MSRDITWDLKNGTIHSGDLRLVMHREMFISLLLDKLAGYGPGLLNRLLLNVARKTNLPTVRDIEDAREQESLSPEERELMILSYFFGGLRDTYADHPPLRNTISILKWTEKNEIMFNDPSRTFIFLPVRMIWAMKKDMEGLLGEHGFMQILSRAARDTGRITGGNEVERYKDLTIEKLFERISFEMSWVFPVLGWGRCSIVTDAEHNRLCFKVANSYESDGLSFNRYNCVIFLNYLVGVAEGIMRPITGLHASGCEIKCVANGDDCCAFFVQFHKPDERLDLSCDEFREKQKEIMEEFPDKDADPTEHPMIQAFLEGG
ncbi:MAG: hypothetical protein JW885_06040 [Deltaproteobacteria bacterium]|nr:hypothetical protein [Candidatus Zymogenaceae bacterium]